MKYEYRRYRHSELQNMILHLLSVEGCIQKRLLRKRLMANPSTFYKAIKALERKGLVKELKLNHEKIICIDI